MKETYVEKHRAKKYADIQSQDNAVNEITSFLKNFPKKKALILHGPPGIGKTSLVHAAANENNLEILELNASDLRNSEKLEHILGPAAAQTSLFKKGKILLMDEIDGLSSNDRGGVGELARIIQTTKFPIIMTSNDVWQSKLSPIRSKSKIIEFKALGIDAIVSILRKVAKKEGLNKDEAFLRLVAIKSQGDVRAALNDMQSYSSASDLKVDSTEKRDIDENIFHVLRRLFKERSDFLELFDSSSLSIDEILLWIEENIPREYKNEALVNAYYALGKADVFRGRIYRQQHWRFLQYQNIFQSAGISYAKKIPLSGFTSYERPKRVLKIWMHNQKTEKKKTISRKYARLVHCSTKRIMRDFELLKPILRNPKVQKQLDLSEEETLFLK